MDFSEIYENLLMEELDAQPFSTKSMHVIKAFVGRNPRSSQYGKIIGFFTYKGKTYRFRFHVHRPKQKMPSLSNKMENIEEVCFFTKYGETFVRYEDTEMGNMAFWTHTPTEYLKKEDEDSYELRLLEEKIIKYSRKENLCQLFRKTDKTALDVNPVYQK